MANALFLSSRVADEASLVASTVAGSLPVAFLQDLRPEKKWRATGCSAEWVTFDLGSAVACNTLGLVSHNLSAAATLRVRAAATAGGVTSAPSIDTTAVSAWPTSGKPADRDWPAYLSLVRWTNNSTYRYWRLDIADSGNLAGYVEAGRVFIGRGFQPTFNVDHGVGLGLVSPDYQGRSSYGAMSTDPRGAAARRLVLPFGAISRRDLMDNLFDLMRYCGLARDFLFSLDPAETTDFHRFSLQAVFDSAAQFQAQPIFDSTAELWTQSISITEPM